MARAHSLALKVVCTIAGMVLLLFSGCDEPWSRAVPTSEGSEVSPGQEDGGTNQDQHGTNDAGGGGPVETPDDGDRGVGATPQGGGVNPNGGDDGSNNGLESWNPTEDNSQGVRLTDDGALTIDQAFSTQAGVWIANDGEGTVSRLDVETGREVGRYIASRTENGHDINPSRTALDFGGNCWVANRYRDQSEVPGSVTKIAAREDRCVDRNGNGAIDTSRDLNDDGRIDPDSDEYLGLDDECVLFTTELGGPGSNARALAIAPDPTGNSIAGNAWIGLNYEEVTPEERTAVQVDGETGEIIGYYPLDINPYGALTSKYMGRVWFTNASWQNHLPDNPPAVQYVEFTSGTVGPRYEVERDQADCVGTYGLTVDHEGHVWVSGHRCPYAFALDPDTEQWRSASLGEDEGVSRGCMADADGYLWVARSRDCGHGECGVVSRIRVDSGEDLRHFILPTGDRTIGVDLDVDGRVWVVNQGTNNASRIDPGTERIEEFPVGERPYSYSDFTGYSLMMNFPRGTHTTTVQGCNGAAWVSAHANVNLPARTYVQIRVRSADTEAGLADAAWLGPWLLPEASFNDGPGPVPPGEYLQVEFNLASESRNMELPELRSAQFEFSCLN